MHVPDLAKEEQAAGIVSAHHEALQKLAAFLGTALWEDTKDAIDEETPRLYAALARCLSSCRSGAAHILEAVKRGVDSLLVWLYQHDGMTGSIAEPDKLTLKFARERDSVAQFLMHQKPRAVRGLAKRIKEPSTPAAERDHSVRTLASITSRQFQVHDIQDARTWLNQQGR